MNTRSIRSSLLKYHLDTGLSNLEEYEIAKNTNNFSNTPKCDLKFKLFRYEFLKNRVLIKNAGITYKFHEVSNSNLSYDLFGFDEKCIYLEELLEANLLRLNIFSKNPGLRIIKIDNLNIEMRLYRNYQEDQTYHFVSDNIFRYRDSYRFLKLTDLDSERVSEFKLIDH